MVTVQPGEPRARAFPAAMNGGNLTAMDESDMPRPQVRITSRLIDSLYTEAMLLAVNNQRFRRARQCDRNAGK